MTNIYRGECLLLGWGESHRDGRYVRLQLDEEGKANPFKGLKTGPNGQRFAVVIRMLNDDQSLGDAPTREDGVAGARRDSTAAPVSSTSPASPKPKGKWSDLKPSAQAAMRVQEKAFWRFMGNLPDAATADFALKKALCIVSKADLDDDRNVHQQALWRNMDRSYLAYLDTQRAAQQFESHGANRG